MTEADKPKEIRLPLDLEVVGQAKIIDADVIQLGDEAGGTEAATRFTFEFRLPFSREKDLATLAILVAGNQRQFVRDGVVDIIQVQQGVSYAWMGVVRKPDGSFLHPGVIVEAPIE